MNPCLDIDRFRQVLSSFKPERYALPRCLAFYSAAIAIGEEELLALAVDRSRLHGVERKQFYEIVLQSYLFLGFPRTVLAGEPLSHSWQ